MTGQRVTAMMACIVLLASSVGSGQVKTTVPDVVPGARPATVERIAVHGKALEANLEGDAVDRTVLVFLPPSYARERNRRYPAVYALHGYSIGAEQWSQEIHVPQTIEGAFALGAQEMIVVLPDSKTVHNGSMYSSSATRSARISRQCWRGGRPTRHSPSSIYSGTHTSHVAVRLQEKVMRFSAEPCHSTRRNADARGIWIHRRPTESV
jgi:hypothetical protein